VVIADGTPGSLIHAVDTIPGSPTFIVEEIPIFHPPVLVEHGKDVCVDIEWVKIGFSGALVMDNLDNAFVNRSTTIDDTPHVVERYSYETQVDTS
jgi:hypothetical protein